MNETYVECLVKRKANPMMKAVKYVIILFAALCILYGMMGVLVPLVAGIVLGVLAYFVNLYSEVEYEYLYVDRQLSVDRVLSQSRRKKIAEYDLERMEILAPIKSYHLDGYKGRQFEQRDYSSGIVNQPDTRYALFYDGKQKIVFEPNEDMVKAIQAVAPRKVFKD